MSSRVWWATSPNRPGDDALQHAAARIHLARGADRDCHRRGDRRARLPRAGRAFRRRDAPRSRGYAMAHAGLVLRAARRRYASGGAALRAIGGHPRSTVAGFHDQFRRQRRRQCARIFASGSGIQYRTRKRGPATRLSLAQRQRRSAVLVELRPSARRTSHELHVAARCRAFPADLSDARQRLDRQLARRRRRRLAARGARAADAVVRRNDRTMAGAALMIFLFHPTSISTSRGAAVVMAMLLSALAATIAATLLWQQQRWITEHQHRRDQVQAQALAMAGVQWTRQIVFEDPPAGTIVHLGQPWALRLPAMPIENGSIAGYIVDAQGRININNLSTGSTDAASTRGALQRLFGALALAATLINAVGDWVDADDKASDPGGAEDAWYLAQPTPSLAANAPVRRLGELLLVRGVSPAAMARGRPFVSALDAPTAVNVNTAPAEVLAATIGGLDAAGAALLIVSREKTPFASVADFKARLPRPDLLTDDTSLTVRSDWV